MKEECNCSVCKKQRFDTTFVGICEAVKNNLSHLPDKIDIIPQESISSTIYAMFEACPDYSRETIIQQSNAAAQAILEEYKFIDFDPEKTEELAIEYVGKLNSPSGIQYVIAIENVEKAFKWLLSKLSSDSKTNKEGSE